MIKEKDLQTHSLVHQHHHYNDDIDSTQRQRSRFVVEDTKGIYNIYMMITILEERKTRIENQFPFLQEMLYIQMSLQNLWSKIIGKEEHD